MRRIGQPIEPPRCTTYRLPWWSPVSPSIASGLLYTVVHFAAAPAATSASPPAAAAPSAPTPLTTAATSAAFAAPLITIPPSSRNEAELLRHRARSPRSVRDD